MVGPIWSLYAKIDSASHQELLTTVVTLNAFSNDNLNSEHSNKNKMYDDVSLGRVGRLGLREGHFRLLVQSVVAVSCCLGKLISILCVCVVCLPFSI